MEHSLAFFGFVALNSRTVLNVELPPHVLLCCIKVMLCKIVRVACVDRIRFTTNQMQKNRLQRRMRQTNGNVWFGRKEKSRTTESTVSESIKWRAYVNHHLHRRGSFESMTMCSYRIRIRSFSCHQPFPFVHVMVLLIDRLLFVERISSKSDACRSFEIGVLAARAAADRAIKFNLVFELQIDGQRQQGAAEQQWHAVTQWKLLLHRIMKIENVHRLL